MLRGLQGILPGFRLLVFISVVFLIACSSEDTANDSDTGSDSAPDTEMSEDAGDTGDASEPAFEMHMVDVGSGMSVVIAGPDFLIVVDGGSDDDTGSGDDNRLVAYLQAIRPDLTHIDHVILTHPHNDHISMLPDLFERYTVDEVWDSGTPSALCSYHGFLTAVEARDAAYHSPVADAGEHVISLVSPCDSDPDEVTLSHGDRITVGMSVALGESAEMTFLFAAETPDETDPNLDSMVIRVDLGDRRILLMGDAQGGSSNVTADPPDSGSIEALLLESPEEIAADVLQVGYHGYSESSHAAFLEAVSPSFSLIASYPNFAPPTQSVLDALEEYGSIFRTDADDDACRANSAKVGTDADDLPGGCDNIRVAFDTEGSITAEYFIPED